MELNLENIIEKIKPVINEIINQKFEEKEKIISIGNKELNELKDIVRNLAIDQNGTKVELNELKNIVKELAEAQKRTEIKVEELAEAQKRTEIKVEELAEAQKRTEEEIRQLVKKVDSLSDSVNDINKRIGGLSETVGYSLEDKSYRALPELLKKDYGIIVEGKLKRGYLVDYKEKEIEVNIIGKGTKDGKELTIIGESKSKLSKSKVDEFIKKKLNRFKGVYKDIFPILVTNMIVESDTEVYVKQKNIAIYYSYDFEV